MATKPRRRRGIAPAHAAARRKAREQLAERDRVLQAWLRDQLAGDGATSRLVWWVGTLHAGLMAWTAEAADAHVLPAGGTGSVSGTADQDLAMLRALAPNLDAEDLEGVRRRVVARVAEQVGWYDRHGAHPMWIGPIGLLNRLSVWTGDAELAGHLAACINAHVIVRGAMPQSRAAEAAWRRVARAYLRLLDGGPT